MPQELTGLLALLKDGGPYGIICLVLFFWWRSDTERARLQNILLEQQPKLAAALNRLTWLIQGRREEEGD